MTHLKVFVVLGKSRHQVLVREKHVWYVFYSDSISHGHITVSLPLRWHFIKYLNFPYDVNSLYTCPFNSFCIKLLRRWNTRGSCSHAVGLVNVFASINLCFISTDWHWLELWPYLAMQTLERSLEFFNVRPDLNLLGHAHVRECTDRPNPTDTHQPLSKHF